MNQSIGEALPIRENGRDLRSRHRESAGNEDHRPNRPWRILTAATAPTGDSVNVMVQVNSVELSTGP